MRKKPDKLSFQRYILGQSSPSIITKLYERPRRIPRINVPRFVNIPDGVYHQADILYLPKDPQTGSKFLLVVVDVGSGKTWALPMKLIKNTLETLKKIYTNNRLPRVLSVDNGTEFKGAVYRWLLSKNVAVKVSMTGRHSQQAMVERRNRAIGGALLKLQGAREISTKKPNLEWESDLPRVMKWINLLAKRRNILKNNRLHKERAVPRAVGKARKLLTEGSIVRVALDYPKDINGKRLHGNFRTSDIRWSKPHRIERLILNRYQPPMYTVETLNGKKLRGAYVRERLQVVGDETMPNMYVINPRRTKRKH